MVLYLMLHHSDFFQRKKDTVPGTQGDQLTEFRQEKSHLVVLLAIGLAAFSLIILGKSLYDRDGDVQNVLAEERQKTLLAVAGFEETLKEIQGVLLAFSAQGPMNRSVQINQAASTLLSRPYVKAFAVLDAKGMPGRVYPAKMKDIFQAGWSALGKTRGSIRLAPAHKGGLSAPKIFIVPSSAKGVGLVALVDVGVFLEHNTKTATLRGLAGPSGRPVWFHNDQGVWSSAKSIDTAWQLTDREYKTLQKDGAVLRREKKSSLVMARSPSGALIGLDPQPVNMRHWSQSLLFYTIISVVPFLVLLMLSIMILRQFGQLRKAHNNVEGSRQNLALALEGAQCGVWSWDQEKQTLSVDAKLSHMLGHKGEKKIPYHDFLRLVDRKDHPSVQEALFKEPRPNHLDMEFHGTGLPVYLRFRGEVWYGPDERFSRRFVGVAMDMTEQKGTQTRLETAENRLRAALDAMSESFVLWDSRRTLVLWNSKFQNFFDIPSSFLKTGASYASLEQAARNKVLHHIYGEKNDIVEMELLDGRWLHYSEHPTVGGGEVSVGTDVTDMKRHEAALMDNSRQLRRTVEEVEKSREQITELAKSYEQEKIHAEEANHSKSAFLANMSHELRTPLNAINGFSEIMMKEMFGPLNNERYQGYIRDINTSGEHLLALINDILDMSKIEAGKMKMHKEKLKPKNIVAQVMRLLQQHTEEAGLTFKTVLEGLPEIEADARAIKQVFLNLLSNAIKFTPEKGSITVRGALKKEYMEFSVIDTGIGIDEKDIARLGKPFEQVHHQHLEAHQGTGLGLALSKSLVEMHGGRLTLESKIGEGTTVSFTLPRQQRKNHPPPQKKQLLQKTKIEFSGDKNKHSATHKS